MSDTQNAPVAANFIRNIIKDDLAQGKNAGKVATRFPPEPNGYLHLGHVKSICLNFGMAREFGGTCNLRFDDTNPEKENEEYMASIKRDVEWLGFTWDALYHASDYFPELLDYAFQLIDKGLAYVDSQDAEQIRASRGTLTEAGQNSPYRERPIEENRRIFQEMVDGKHADGAHVLRAYCSFAYDSFLSFPVARTNPLNKQNQKKQNKRKQLKKKLKKIQQKHKVQMLKMPIPLFLNLKNKSFMMKRE